MCIPPYELSSVSLTSDNAIDSTSITGSLDESVSKASYSPVMSARTANDETFHKKSKKKARMSRMEKARMYGGKF